ALRGQARPEKRAGGGEQGAGEGVAMALAKRVIPCLDVTAGRVVKGVNFVGLRDAGDPVEIAARYDREGADELCFLDITASSEERDMLLGVIESVAAQVFIPLTVGGGVILLTSMDRDGTRDGFDVALTRAVSEVVGVPVIASGGAGSLEHLAQGVLEGKADAVLAASIFHFGEFSVQQAKAHLKAR